MNKKMMFPIVILVVLGAAYAAYEFWFNQPKPQVVQLKKTPPAPAATPPAATQPAASQVAATPVALPPLPQLAQSDSYVLDALAAVVGNPSVMKVFHTKRIVNNIVATVNSLPEQRVPVKLMPFNPPSGRFLTAGPEDHLTISPRNANRYTAYVNIAEAIDAKKLVGLYIRLYPLFQQSYKELGYPNDNFNDQLSETLDDLLETPDVKEPIKLVQPKYFYLYADPDLEALSIGQKIMLRLGSKNATTVKNKLLEIKQELALHTNELK